MNSHTQYIKNVVEYYEKGMPIDEAVDRAIAVDLLGEEIICCAGEDTQAVISFAKVVHNYINLTKKLEV